MLFWALFVFFLFFWPRFLVGGLYCSVLLLSCYVFFKGWLKKRCKLAVCKLDLSRGGLTRCHSVLDHGLNFREALIVAVTRSPQFTLLVCYPAAGQVYRNVSCWVYSKVFIRCVSVRRLQLCAALHSPLAPAFTQSAPLYSSPRLHVFTCWTVFWSSWQAGRKMQTEACREVSSLLSLTETAAQMLGGPSPVCYRSIKTDRVKNNTDLLSESCGQPLNRQPPL